MNSMIIEKLRQASVIDNTGKVNLENLEEYVLTNDVLVIMYDVTENNQTETYLRAVANRWVFQDNAMGEQFLSFDLVSETPVLWAVNDYCIFRGERYNLNYIPSVVQRARKLESMESFKYESVKMDSLADELTRCQMLDVVLSSSQHDPDAGTNYTGSAVFQLFCGETTVNVQGQTVTRTAVMTLGDRILANLKRMYHDGQGNPLWSIVYGENTHTEDQALNFDNQSVAQALAEVKNKFDLDYAIKGRTIYIGCELGDVADVEYGYGPGYPTEEAGGKGLFEIRKISDSSQQLVTRLRVLGSTKNLPYRYYNKAYSLPQSLFPLNLQLPDTFLPEGSPSDPAGTDTKWGHNRQRPSLRAVQGATNDSYIDKNDDAAHTPEGIREATIRFDGSNSKLKEIYPTIEDVTYDELRASNVPDQEGNTGVDAYPGYDAAEKVNELLAIGYKYDGQMFDDANIGSGILSDDNGGQSGSVRDIYIPMRTEFVLAHVDDYYCGTEQTLFTVTGQTAGKYFFTPVMNKEPYFSYSALAASDPVGFIIRIKATSGGTTTVLAEYKSDFYSGWDSVVLPSIPDVFYMADAKVREIALSGAADITVTFTPCSRVGTAIRYSVGPRQGGSYTAQYVWNNVDSMDSSNMPFHVFVKDMGFDFEAQFNGDTPTIAMKSGECVGREFQISEAKAGVDYDGKLGYVLTLVRAEDTSLNVYYPNARNIISADDQFVITGIDMPDAYIKAAEIRLLTAATDWLAHNGDTHFRYQPSIDDIYLKRNYDNMVKAGTPEDSVFWKLYAGYELTFIPIQDTPGEPDPLSVTIESLTITMGDGLTRKVEITLNDELKESTLKRVTREVDELSKQRRNEGSGMSSITIENTVRKIGDKQYLSKVDNDTAEGDITFNGSILFSKNALFKRGAYFGETSDGTYAAEITHQGDVKTKGNVQAEGGVAANGYADMDMAPNGGGGTATAVEFDPNVPYNEHTAYSPSSQGLITLPAYPSLAGLASEAWVQSHFAAKGYETRVQTIEGLIPAQATSSNQLADKAFVNSSIATATAAYQGSYNLVSDLSLTTSATRAQIATALASAISGEDDNDYAFVEIPTSDSTPTQIARVERYKYNGSAWGYEYTLNNSGMTAAQWAAVNSGITASKVSAYDAHVASTSNPHNVTKAQVGLGNVENTALSTWAGTTNINKLGTITTGVWHGTAIADTYIASASAWNAKYDKPSGGIPKTDLAQGVQDSLGLADTALQSHQTIYSLTIKKNGTQVGNVYNPATGAQTIDITDVASANALSGVATRVGDLEGYFDANGVANNAAKLGGQLPSYYAVAADYTKTTDFKSLTIKGGTTSVGTYSPTSALTFSIVAGTNISVTPDATNHKITINNTYSLPTASASDKGGVIVGNTLTISNAVLNAKEATAVQAGIVNTGTQTFAGNKTLQGNFQATGGVAADGYADLSIGGNGGGGSVSALRINSGTAFTPDANGLISLTASEGSVNGAFMLGGESIPIHGLQALAYKSSILIGDHYSPVADAGSQLSASASGASAAWSIDVVKAVQVQRDSKGHVVGITVTSGKIPAKPTYAFSNLTSHPDTLGGYGITDAKIESGVITLGSNSITPLTGINATMINNALGFTLSGTSGQTYNLATISSNASNGNTAYGYFSNGVLPASKGGTGKTSLSDAGSAIINALGEGSSPATRNDYIVAQYAGGGTTTTTYHRRKLSNIFAALNSGDITTALGYTPFDNASFTQANIKSTLGISDWALAASKPSYAFSEITGTVTNSQLAGSIANSKLASAGKFTIGSTAIELGTTYTAANFRSYLGLGGAATYGATSSVTDGGTSLVTSGGVYSYVNALLTAAMKIEGETTTAISDGSTTNPVTIGGQSVNAYKGMVVFYGSKEFVWVGTNWKELGDESSFALKTTTVSGTGYLTGGGALSSNQTIDIESSVKTKIDNGATAYGWGNHANAGYALASNLGTASTHAHGDYVTGMSWDSTNNKLAWSKGGTAQTAITIGYASSAGSVAWGNVTSRPTKLSDFTDDLGSSPTHTHSQYSLTTHTHTTSISTSTGTNQITLGYGSKYAITAGGTSYVFTMPSLGSTSSQAAAGNHVYHYLTANGEYFDSYSQDKLFRIVYENMAKDILRFQASTISNVQYWNYDNSTWTTWNKNLSPLFGGSDTGSVSIPYAQRKFRFQITANSGWPTTAMFLLQGSWFDSGAYSPISGKAINVIIETRANTSASFATKLEFGFTNSTQGTNARVISALHTGETLYRITIELCPWANTSNSPSLRKIAILSNHSGSNVAQANYDSNGNFFPLIDDKYSLGNTSYKWKNVYATSFTENGTALSSKYLGINANAVSATKATNDSDGNAINTTYLKKSGGTMTGALGISTANWENQLILNRVNNSTNWGATIVFKRDGNYDTDLMAESGHLYVSGDAGNSRKKVWDEANDGSGSGLDADLLDGQHGSYYQPKVSALGSTTEPVYISAAGTFSKASKYAGGTAVTLNNSSKAASTASFYAPTTGGTKGYSLIGNGTTSAPVWSSLLYHDTTNNRIGIGTTSPTHKLHVNGDICGEAGVSANGYADLSIGGGSGAGSVAAISVGGTAYTPDASALVTIPVSATGNTLQWGAATKIADIGGLALNVTLPANPNTHYSTGITAGASGTTSNSAIANPYIKIKDDTTHRAQIRMLGSGRAAVASDANGNVTTSVTDKYTMYSTSNVSSLTLKLGESVSSYSVHSCSSTSYLSLSLSTPSTKETGVMHYLLIVNTTNSQMTITMPSGTVLAPAKTVKIPSNSSMEISYIYDGTRTIMTWSQNLVSVN